MDEFSFQFGYLEKMHFVTRRNSWLGRAQIYECFLSLPPRLDTVEITETVSRCSVESLSDQSKVNG